MTDQELIAAYQGGDRQAFNTLYRKYNQRLLSFACRWVSYWEAADVVQDVWLHVIKHLHTYAPEKDSEAGAWIFAIARHRMIDLHQKSQRQKRKGIEISIDERRDDQEVPALGLTSRQDNYEDREQVEQVKALLDHIHEAHAEAIRLRDVKGYTYKEICTITSASMGTVKSRLYRGRNQIKELYAA